MRKTLSVIGLTLLILSAMDFVVAMTLNWAEKNGKLESLVQYFEYGRSVPGKLARWENNPGTSGNLYDVAWRSEILAASNKAFQEEDAAHGPVLRSYGMSFVNKIIEQAVEIDPTIRWDKHSGPGSPPNFTYSLFQDDRSARRPGDIAVLGILSASVTGMAALSNRTRVFEQPAPFTYPIYWPDGTGLRRVEPIINSSAEQRSPTEAKRKSWENQLHQEDFFFCPQAYGLPWLDWSPFAKLVRRSLATASIKRTKMSILAGEYPYVKVLHLMVDEFARVARQDEQTPIVMLIQSRDPSDPNILEIMKPILERKSIPYFATVEHFDPSDVSGFLEDGHYKPEIDRHYATRFIKLIEEH